jgi:class 3 adenylate cyclase
LIKGGARERIGGPVSDGVEGKKSEPLGLSIEERANGRILVVDDTRAIRGIVRNALVAQNWSVTTAEGGADAIAQLATAQFEAIVCDLNMPDVDGFQVLKRAKEVDPSLPVIVLSGQGDLTHVLRAVRDGAFDFVSKEGGDLRPLLAAVDRAVSHGRIVRENLRLNVALTAKVEQLVEEKRRSDWLLHNLLPTKIADRLKSEKQLTMAPESHPAVTVVFADIVGFSGLARKTAGTPKVLIGMLDDLFCTFDSLAENYGVEKIKTIGDAYMAAAGLPDPQPDHATRAIKLAQDMLHEVGAFGGRQLNLRVGISSGPVVAGLIGQKRAIFDLWGDTVNLASRMESQGIEGRIQVTDATKKLLEPEFRFEERGAIDVKGYGAMKTWLLASPTRAR